MAQTPPYFDFGIALDVGNSPINIELTSTTNFNEAISIVYNYTGPTPITDSRVDFNYTILDYDCTNVFAAQTDVNQALKFTDFAYPNPGHVQAKLGIALDKIESSSVWSHPDGSETTALLQFCGRWEIYVDNRYTTFHESMVNATINLKEDGGFDLSSLSVGLDRNDANKESQQVEVQFPVSVFFCNDNAGAVDPPDPVYQGTTIQVCLKLATQTTGVYVHSIDEMTYHANDYTGNAEALFQDGQLMHGSTTQVDCASVPSLCRVKFLAKADMFMVDDTSTNNLVIAGWAVVALGSDPDNTVVALDPGPDNTRRRRRRRHILEEGERLAPFEFVLENLQPLPDQEPVRSGIWVVLAVVVVFLLVAIAAVVAYFVFRRRRVLVNKAAEAKSTGLQKKDSSIGDGTARDISHTEDISDSNYCDHCCYDEDPSSDYCERYENVSV